MKNATRSVSILLAAMMLFTSISFGSLISVSGASEGNDSTVQTYEDDFGDSASKDEYQSNGVAFDIKDGALVIDGDGVVGLKNYIWDNAEYELDIDISDKSEWAGIQFNKEKPTDNRDDPGYMLYVRSSGSVELYTGSAGAFAKGSVSTIDEKKVHLKISVVNGLIEVYANNSDTPIISVEDDTYDYGYFSFVNYMAGKVSYDNLKITAKPSDGKIKKIIIGGLEDGTSIPKGETVKLTTRVIPADAELGNIRWSVTDVYGNPSVLASVSEDGYLTAGNISGVIRVSAVATDGSGVSGSVTAVVVDAKESNGGELEEREEFSDDFERDYEIAFKDYGQAVSSINDGKMTLSTTFNGITTLIGRKFANATYSYDMNVDGAEWGSFLFGKTAESDTWDWSGYMFLVQPSGSYQLICAGKGQIASGVISGFENKMNHYTIKTGDGKILVYYNQDTEPFIDAAATAYAEPGYVSFGISLNSVEIDNLLITDESGNELYSNDFEMSIPEEIYEAVRSTYTIADGELQVSAAWGGAITSIPQIFGAAVYEFDMNVDEVSDWGAFLFCRDDPAHIWDNSGYLFLVTPSGDYQLHASTGSGLNQLAAGAIPEYKGGYGHYKIVKTNSTIDIYYGNGTEPFISVENSSYLSGYAGFAATNTGTVKYDNLSIAAINEAGLPSLTFVHITGAYGTNVMKTNSTLSMSAYTEPVEVDPRDLKWTVVNADGSADPIAEISSSGVLTAKDSEGTVIVRAESVNGVVGETQIAIKKSVTPEAVVVTADKNARIMGVGKTVTMTAQLYPYTADEAKIVWSVTNTDGSATDLAEITEGGVLTSKAAGTVRIRASLSDNSSVYGEWIMTIGKITTNGENDMASMKFSFFAHYVADLTTDVNGKVVTDPNALADAFDAEAYADKMAAMGVEYVVFTAWHYRMVVLYDSQVMLDWDMANHRTDRDMLGDMIDAVQARGINVVLYTHPFDGYDFKTAEEGLKVGWGSALKPEMTPYYDKDFDYDKWNNFINDVYGEVMERYGDRIAGVWCDEGNMWEGMSKAVDFPRLLETIKSYNPNVATFQNDHGFLYGFKYRIEEYWKHAEFADYTGNSLKTFTKKVPNPIISNDWWTTGAISGTSSVPYGGDVLFMYQVLQSGASSGGGIQWAAGPYPGEGCLYETGVVETMEIMNAYLNPIAWTVKGTLASTSYVTGDNKTIKTVGWGVATKSTDDTREYIHVLNADSDSIDGRTITLPAPADGKVFLKAYLAVNNLPVELEQTDTYVKLTLPEGTDWNEIDTVIELAVDADATSGDQSTTPPETADRPWGFYLLGALISACVIPVTICITKKRRAA